MDALQILKRDWDEYRNFRPFEVTKYEWLSENIFDLTTYDNSLNERFGKKIFDVCKTILDGATFEYIQKSEQHYVDYILVCQLLEKFRWIEWGSSIRGAWFEEQDESRYIFAYWDGEYKELQFTEENIRLLIEFVEEAEQE